MAANFSAIRRFPGIIRLALLLLSLIALIFIIVAIVMHGTDDFVAYEAVTFDAISIVTYAWTFCWSISALCVLIFHGPYHPGIDIGLDFIGWGLAWGWAPLVLVNATARNYPSDCQYEDSYRSANFCTNAKALMAMEILAGVLSIIYGAIHLWMVVEAIKALRSKRRSGQQKPMNLSEQA